MTAAAAEAVRECLYRFVFADAIKRTKRITVGGSWNFGSRFVANYLMSLCSQLN